MPNSQAYDALAANAFADYRLRVSGLIEAPQDLSLADLKAMPKQAQITDHFCIQGWSGVAKWSGVPMREILDLARRCCQLNRRTARLVNWTRLVGNGSSAPCVPCPSNVIGSQRRSSVTRCGSISASP
ncbi:molybdopterin-dependent oxidoreductase [Caulobacter sp. DWP3-1-3b2]|uniref:molybdopterin-dependent oxidoreductase n=1 Tax=Caulobacter sp. DWP3-1-3b2 TaxID=2804643 RepID=UPI003CEE6FD3